jgi:elongation factor Ts
VAQISAASVKALRDQTGAGMMDCKKALSAADGDVAKAVEFLREQGLAKAGKREGRATSEGVIAVSVNGASGGIVELGCETDFVARTDDFKELAQSLAAAVAGDACIASVEVLLDATADGEKVSERLMAAIAKLGENVVVKRIGRLEVPGGVVGAYVHGPGKLGVLVALETEGSGDGVAALAKDLAMHVAAADPIPIAVASDGVSAELVDSERRIYRKQAEQEGKPEKIIDRIVEGKLKKFFSEVVLLDQPFVKDADRSVAELLSDVGKEVGTEVAVAGFQRFRLGEASET